MELDYNTFSINNGLTIIIIDVNLDRNVHHNDGSNPHMSFEPLTYGYGCGHSTANLRYGDAYGKGYGKGYGYGDGNGVGKG